MIVVRRFGAYAVAYGLCFCWLFASPLAAAPEKDMPRVPLDGTRLLEIEGDIASEMIDSIDRFLMKQIDASVERRAQLWQRDFSSGDAYHKSVEPNRQRFRKAIGVVDERRKFQGFQYLGSTTQGARIGEASRYNVYTVRWPVVHGIHGEGLLLEPKGSDTLANVIAIPDADHTPEMLVGLDAGIDPASQFARRLAETGCRVLVPTLVDRGDQFSTISPDLVRDDPAVGRRTGLTHREYIYRAAFEMGRHVIGYEVQKVLSAVDEFMRDKSRALPVGVVGYGEGGLLALYAAAIDERIFVTLTSGYFESRQEVWKEPIERNVFSLLHEFGDAEIASLVSPRPLVIEAAPGPELVIEPGTRRAPGRLRSPPVDAVRAEVQRARALLSSSGGSAVGFVELVTDAAAFGSTAALSEFLEKFSPQRELPAAAGELPRDLRKHKPSPDARQQRQVREMDAYTQFLAREAEAARGKFWSKANHSSIETWTESVEWYRDYLYREVIGRFDGIPLGDPNVRSVKFLDEPAYDGYRVVMDCMSDYVAYGILLIPKNIRPGEKRPVVVCQHGLEGRPRDVADPKVDVPYYKRFACHLAERGFITFAPQNPYIFVDRFRVLQRKANPIKKSLFSIIIPQHQQIVDWLASLPMVDPKRIGFYGLSYGGKTAMRVPPMVKGYCLSICSADFNEWIWKNVSTRSGVSYVNTIEYEIFEFDLGNTFNYAEMAGLIAPRPFMVERGHYDGVAPDTQVAYEYARVRLLYRQLKIPERTEIEFFDGPHRINGVGTFSFLHKHLRWPAP